MQELAHTFNGTVAAGVKREYGKANLTKHNDADSNGLWMNLPDSFEVWMSHGDKLTECPDGFVNVACTSNAEHCVIAHETKKIYGNYF